MRSTAGAHPGAPQAFSDLKKSRTCGKKLLPADAHSGNTDTACAYLRQDAVVAIKRKAAHVYAVAVMRFCCGRVSVRGLTYWAR